ncbi:MAG: hypothetical protein II007_02200 [Gammaproteobacteria bacterium]|nr:hypothetical protein [Gammaproteobacteria bacterium]
MSLLVAFNQESLQADPLMASLSPSFLMKYQEVVTQLKLRPATIKRSFETCFQVTAANDDKAMWAMRLRPDGKGPTRAHYHV